MNSEIKIPDIGNATDVDVIEVMVKQGDTITKDDPLITLETEKASMDVPSPCEGTIAEVKVAVGDKVSEGDLIFILEGSSSAEQSSDAEAPDQPQDKPEETATKQAICIPDIGGTAGVDVIEVLVAIGDHVEKEDSLITLEGDKATMEIPAPFSGTVEALTVKIGDKVSEGDEILQLLTTASSPKPEKTQKSTPKPAAPSPTQVPVPSQAPSAPTVPPAGVNVYAGPAVRRTAYEFGIDLNKITGSGRKGRIIKSDLQTYVKQRLASPDTGIAGLSIAPAADIDFARFGKIETKTLNKIKRLTGSSVHRSWLTAPQVTQFDEIDITELEKFRKDQKAKAEKEGYKLTVLAFAVKAVVKALHEFPQFNASLDAKAENLIVKHYCHIGIAVDTPNGLVVPVLRDVDQKGVFELAEEMTSISKKARDKGLTLKEMEGGCFTISSLGGISGTAFTPIVNTPEVAILGLSRSKLQPVYSNGEFVPRLILPVSLSYDHRVIDGAEAARFTAYLAESLTDIRRLLL